MQKKMDKISRLYITFNTLKRTEYDYQYQRFDIKKNYEKNYS